jgi:hypothetical protein
VAIRLMAPFGSGFALHHCPVRVEHLAIDDLIAMLERARFTVPRRDARGRGGRRRCCLAVSLVTLVLVFVPEVVLLGPRLVFG